MLQHNSLDLISMRAKDGFMPPGKQRNKVKRPKGGEKIQIQVLVKPKARRDAAGISRLQAGELLSLNQWLNENRELLGPRHTD
jgi:hypothetical protein